jgi:hypothetical protein
VCHVTAPNGSEYGERMVTVRQEHSRNTAGLRDRREPVPAYQPPLKS